MTFGTLGLELALAIFVWNRTLRPWVLALGVTLHLSIGFSIMVGFFSMLMLTTYLTFLPPETARRLVLSVRRRLGDDRLGDDRTGRSIHTGIPCPRSGARPARPDRARRPSKRRSATR